MFGFTDDVSDSRDEDGEEARDEARDDARDDARDAVACGGVANLHTTGMQIGR